MRAILIATGYRPGMESLSEHAPLSLLPLVDRPFLQHVVEFLVGEGITDFDFILSHLPEKIESFLGDGTRWGSSFRYHLARNRDRPYGFFKQILSDSDDPYLLLVHTDRLPDTRLALPTDASEPMSRLDPILFCWQDQEPTLMRSAQWTGWAWLSRTSIDALPDDCDEERLSASLLSLGERTGVCIEVPKPLSMQSYGDLLEAHDRLLAHSFPHIVLSGREVDKGVWISRNVSLHPTTKIIPPVYLGENCQIGRGTQLGPHAVVGDNCVLSARCTIEQSVIFSGSYVGEGLELVDAIVDKNRLINTRVGVDVVVTDNFLLGSMTDHHIQRSIGTALSRLTGAMLLLISSPLLAAIALYLKLMRHGPVLYTKEVVALPAPSDETRWRTFQLWRFCPEVSPAAEEMSATRAALHEFFLRGLPALMNVARGDLRLVGVMPRTPDEIRALPLDWRTLYLCAHAGIVTEAYVYQGPTPSDDELYTSEAYYSATASIRHNTRLLCGYFGRLFSSLF